MTTIIRRITSLVSWVLNHYGMSLGREGKRERAEKGTGREIRCGYLSFTDIVLSINQRGRVRVSSVVKL